MAETKTLTPPAPELLGANIVRLLEQKGWALDDFAFRLWPDARSPGHAASNLRKYIRGEKWPRGELFTKIAQEFGVQRSELLRELE